MCLSCKDIARQSCAMVRRWLFLATFLHPAFPASRVQHASDLHLKFALRPHHVWKYDKPRDYDDMTSWQIKSWLLDCGIIHQARVYHGYLVTRRSVTELTRHRASTNMYSLTFSRSRYNTPRSMDEMEWRTQQACLLSGCRRGESLPACIVCDAVCGTGTACGQSGGLPLGSATHFHSVARATQPVH